MTFGSPDWFWALFALPLFLALFLWNEKRSTEMIRRVIAARLLPQLAGNVSYFRRRLRYCLLLLGFSLLVVAMARPRIGYQYEEAKRKGHDVIIAVDTSRSMLANDLRPNRLTRAKMAAQDLIMNLRGDRVGLVAFAGNAFLQAPLTIDYGAVLNALLELDTEIIPRGGTNIAEAIDTAVEAFGKGESDSRALVIFTDGEELDADGIALAGKYAGQLSIFTIGVGSEEGSIIPIQREGGGTDFVRDAANDVVLSKLDEKRLEDIAEASGGFYERLENGPANMKRVVREGLGSLTEQQIDARMARRPIERYQWPLAAGLVLLASSILISDRKRRKRTQSSIPLSSAIAVFSAVFVVADASPAYADGVRMYHEEDFEGAYQYFQKLLNRRPDSAALHYDAGTAAYKLGNYDKALKAFSQALTSTDDRLRESVEYNLGNTLFKRGAARESNDEKIEEWKGALEHYDQALAMNSDNENARFNRDLVEKLIDDLEKQQQQQQKNEENQKNGDQDRERKDESGESDKEQEKQDKENQDDPEDRGGENGPVSRWGNRKKRR
jgi:Ca-activated chloride channel family protein